VKLAILTTAREPSYLRQTIASVLASDWPEDIVVSVDPPSRHALRELEHHTRIRVDVWDAEGWARVADSRVHRKATANYCRCLDIVGRDPEGGIILEDDVVVRDDFYSETRNLRTRARDMRGDDDYAVLLYSARDPERIHCAGTASVMFAGLFFGTQGMYWTAEAAGRVGPYLFDNGVVPNQSVYDLLINQYGRNHGGFVLVLPEESVVQHVGRSTTGMGSFHSSPTFRARERHATGVCFLTAGVGGRWPRDALRVEDRLRALYPHDWVKAYTHLPEWLPCRLPSVSWFKVFGWDLVPEWCETLVWVDADVVPVRALDPLPDGDFCATPDASCSVGVARRRMASLDPTATYYNCGIWIARRRTEPLFRCLRELLVSGAPAMQPFYEQSFLNMLLQSIPLRATDMPRQFNWMSAFGNPPDDVVHIHRAGSHGGLDDYWREWTTGERTRLRLPKEPEPDARGVPISSSCVVRFPGQPKILKREHPAKFVKQKPR